MSPIAIILYVLAGVILCAPVVIFAAGAIVHGLYQEKRQYISDVVSSAVVATDKMLDDMKKKGTFNGQKSEKATLD